jgi:CRISPR-associated endonuclease Cas2
MSGSGLAKRRPLVFAYDIASNKRRRRLFVLLKDWGFDAQFSVFECSLTQSEAAELILETNELIDQQQDRVLLAWLHTPWPAQVIAGTGSANFSQATVYLG